MAKALKRGAYYVYYCYFNCSLRFCRDHKWYSLILFPEPDTKIAEMTNEDRLRRIYRNAYYTWVSLRMKFNMEMKCHSQIFI